MLRELRNIWSIWRWCRQNDLISDVHQKEWFDRQSADPSIKMYKVVGTEQTGEKRRLVLAVCGLTSLCHFNQRAEFSLYVIPGLENQGFGRKALHLLLSHAFGNLNLRLVWGEVLEGNPAEKLYQSMGFKHEGFRRNFYFKDWRFWGANLYSMTGEEWKALSEGKLEDDLCQVG